MRLKIMDEASYERRPQPAAQGFTRFSVDSTRLSVDSTRLSVDSTRLSGWPVRRQDNPQQMQGQRHRQAALQRSILSQRNFPWSSHAVSSSFKSHGSLVVFLASTRPSISTR